MLVLMEISVNIFILFSLFFLPKNKVFFENDSLSYLKITAYRHPNYFIEWVKPVKGTLVAPIQCLASVVFDKNSIVLLERWHMRPCVVVFLHHMHQRRQVMSRISRFSSYFCSLHRLFHTYTWV